MTIERVMQIATQLCRDYVEYTKSAIYSPVMYGKRDELRAAILALVDAEVEPYKLAKADHDRLVRELDVLLCGEDAAPQASLCDIVAKVSTTRVELEQISIFGWPKLDKPARVGSGTFGVGVSAKLVVSAAQAAYANEAERRAMTKEQRQADERNRREFWEMVNGPLEAKP